MRRVMPMRRLIADNSHIPDGGVATACRAQVFPWAHITWALQRTPGAIGLLQASKARARYPSTDTARKSRTTLGRFDVGLQIPRRQVTVVTCSHAERANNAWNPEVAGLPPFALCDSRTGRLPRFPCLGNDST